MRKCRKELILQTAGVTSDFEETLSFLLRPLAVADVASNFRGPNDCPVGLTNWRFMYKLGITAARWFGKSRASLSLWCQGLNQSTHGTHNNAALIHLHLATGQIGRPGHTPGARIPTAPSPRRHGVRPCSSSPDRATL